MMQRGSTQYNWLSVPAAAQQAQISDSTFLNWVRRDPTLARKIGGRWRVDADRLQRILDGTAPLNRGR